jgi:Calcineurin-like phosphoesterase
MAGIFWFADGVGSVGNTSTATTLIRWIRSQAPDLVVYGGDVYQAGTPGEFATFFNQIDRNVKDLCEVAGNHDWETNSGADLPDRVPTEYEAFWKRFPPPLSQQPIDVTARGGHRYDHVKDIGGWRLVFVDTGPCRKKAWPMADATRSTWLRRVLTETPGRAKIVFAHHSRLSRGKHGDVDKVDPLWRDLFDPATSAPLAALTVGGHDHMVSWYKPRPKNNPGSGAVPIAQGIFAHVNGAGGNGHDGSNFGSASDWEAEDDYAVTKITLISPTAADVSVFGFGIDVPAPGATPALRKTFELRL